MTTATRKLVQSNPGSGLNFGDLDFYSGSSLLPKGKWCIKHQLVLHAGEDKKNNKKFDTRLGDMMTCWNLDDPGSEPVTQFMSMGTKAKESFMPDPDTGTTLLPVPGGPQSSLPRNTNFMIFLESLYKSGMPRGFFTSDISVLQYMCVQIDHAQEPDERKGYASEAAAAMTEVVNEQKGSGPKQTVIVSAFLQGGKPWEGQLALPDGYPEAATGVKKPAAQAAATRRPAAAATAAAAEATGDLSPLELANAAQSAMGDVLSKKEYAKSVNKTKFRVAVLAAITDKLGDEVTTQVADTVFGSPEALAFSLGEIGYKLDGMNIIPDPDQQG